MIAPLATTSPLTLSVPLPLTLIAVPPVPPHRYRRKDYMTPQGYQAIEEWFMGFRHGSSTALASGLRQLVVIPVADPPVVFGRTGNPTPAPGQALLPGGNTEQPQTLPPPAGETLPAPRTVPPGEVGPPPPPARPMPPAAPPP